MARYLEKYLCVSVGYNMIRKFAMLWDAKVECSVKEKGTVIRPMLIGEKLSVFCISTVYSPVLTPIWFVNDLNILDTYMSGKRLEEYGLDIKKTSVLDYVFT